MSYVIRKIYDDARKEIMSEQKKLGSGDGIKCDFMRPHDPPRLHTSQRWKESKACVRTEYV